MKFHVTSLCGKPATVYSRHRAGYCSQPAAFLTNHSAPSYIAVPLQHIGNPIRSSVSLPRAKIVRLFHVLLNLNFITKELHCHFP